jgi:DNA repair protein RecN (Recombination protein N)
MLRELFVQNLAIIEDVRVELQPGFCVWTGETGAGKSLLLAALALLMGERGSTDLLRKGADELRVTGRFELTHPATRREVERLLDFSLDDDQLILSRRLTRSGRGYAYLNDQPFAVTTLRQLGALLVDIHGQHESQALLQPAFQLQLLDAYGHLDEPRQDYLQRAEQVRELRQRHAALLAERQARQRELALLRFEREELDEADLRPGELAELTRERERLVHAQALQEFANAACLQLYDAEGSIVEKLGKHQREAQTWAAVVADLAEVASRFQGLVSEVQDLAQTLRTLSQRWESDPARLDAIEKRLQLLRRLEAKYDRKVEELLDYRAALDEREQTLQGQEDDLDDIEQELREAFAQLRESAASLSQQRQRVARQLAAATQRQLTELGMEGARLSAALETVPLGEDPTTAEVPAFGIDQLELTLAANPGEPEHPLRKVASGGELSRTMLALKTVLSAHDHRVTLVFDEIDANVGGRRGDVVGQKLAALGQTHQVLCVTHLPQVASYARSHWTIRKARRGNRTVTTIHALDEAERLEELASMLRGQARGETTRQEAAAMLAAAKERW